MIINIQDPLLLEISQLAQQHQVDVFVVGGYVRDTFLQRQRSDIDLTVVGDALEFARIVATHFRSKAVVY